MDCQIPSGSARLVRGKPLRPQKNSSQKFAKHYIEEHNFGKLLSLAGHLPEYLHGVDKAANDLYDVMYEKLSKDERYKRTGSYLEDVRRREEIHRLIEEEILNEIVYVD